MTCIFVGNLTKNISEKDLQNLFSTIGPCHIDQKGPYAFVDYETPSAAREAIKKFHRTTYLSEIIDIFNPKNVINYIER